MRFAHYSVPGTQRSDISNFLFLQRQKSENIPYHDKKPACSVGEQKAYQEAESFSGTVAAFDLPDNLVIVKC